MHGKLKFQNALDRVKCLIKIKDVSIFILIFNVYFN